MRVAVAMSGGVDSSVAALLLKERGFEVIGLTMKLWPCPDTGEAQPVREKQCCSWRDTRDAAEACHRMGLPHFVFDLEEEFERHVIRPFVKDYAEGRTPIPCVACNQHIKYKPFVRRARELGCDRIATGHYARVLKDNGTPRLARPADARKDQTYFLYSVTSEELALTEWPLADMTKDQVRERARQMALPNADKPESQDICFVLDGDYANVVRSYRPDAFRPGPIMNASGEVLGRHRGLPHFTVGQRRGLGIPAQRALYVLELDVRRNAVIVGALEELMERSLIVDQTNWIGMPKPSAPIRCTAKVRYRSPEAPCTVAPAGDGTYMLTFDEPQRAITPGQAAVLYDGDLVLGGGRIIRAVKGDR